MSKAVLTASPCFEIGVAEGNSALDKSLVMGEVLNVALLPLGRLD